MTVKVYNGSPSFTIVPAGAKASVLCSHRQVSTLEFRVKIWEAGPDFDTTSATYVLLHVS